MKFVPNKKNLKCEPNLNNSQIYVQLDRCLVTCVNCFRRCRPKADDRRSKFLVRETRYEKLGTRNLYTSCIQVSRTRNMADDRDDKEFQILFFSG